MRDVTVHPRWIAAQLRIRDGAYAMQALRDAALQPESPEIAEAERELAARADALCDQAVAAFGRDARAVRSIYNRTEDPLARFAVLANPYYKATGWGASVLDLDQATALLCSGDPADLQVFMANPRLSPDGLLDVLLRRGPASSLSPDHPSWPAIFQGLAENPSLGDLFDTSRRLPNAAARQSLPSALLECVRWLPPAEPLATALAGFLTALHDDRAPGTTFPPGDVAATVLHWHPDVSSDASGSSAFRVQMLLAILFGSRVELPARNAFASARAASMALANVSSDDELETLADVDAAAFFAGIPFNPALYEDHALGTTFLSLAAGSNEAAMALYLSRRSKFDRLWQVDRAVTARDLAVLRRVMRDDHKQGASKDDVESLLRDREAMVEDDAARRAWIRYGHPKLSRWRRAVLAAVILIIVLLLIEMVEIRGLTP